MPVEGFGLSECLKTIGIKFVLLWFCFFDSLNKLLIIYRPVIYLGPSRRGLECVVKDTGTVDFLRLRLSGPVRDVSSTGCLPTKVRVFGTLGFPFLRSGVGKPHKWRSGPLTTLSLPFHKSVGPKDWRALDGCPRDILSFSSFVGTEERNGKEYEGMENGFRVRLVSDALSRWRVLHVSWLFSYPISFWLSLVCGSPDGSTPQSGPWKGGTDVGLSP